MTENFVIELTRSNLLIYLLDLPFGWINNCVEKEDYF